MERYKEISLAELFEHIMKEDYKEIYYQKNPTGNLYKASTEDWSFKEYKQYRWFKREVLD